MKHAIDEAMPDFTAKPFQKTNWLASNAQADIDSNAMGLISMDSSSAIEMVRPQQNEAAAYVDELDSRIARLEAAITIYKAARIQVVQALSVLEDEARFGVKGD